MKMPALFRFGRHGFGLLAVLAGGLAGCGGGDGPAALSVHHALVSVEGSACSVWGAEGKALAGPVATQSGVAAFKTLPATALGWQKVVCQGGTHLDEATGIRLPAPTLRAYAPLGGSAPTVVVSPLTDMAVALLGPRRAADHYPTVRTTVATAFGLEGMDVASVVPAFLSQVPAADTPAGRHGVVLAALSQLVSGGNVGSDLAAVMAAYAAQFDDAGHIKDTRLRDEYGFALEDLLDNPRLAPQLGDAGLEVLQALFDNTQAEDPLASVLYVNTDFSGTRSGEPDLSLTAGEESTIAVVGRNLHLELEVTLAGLACTVRDLESLTEAEIETPDEQLFADCPAVAAGTAPLVVRDAGETVFQADMAVVPAITLQRAQKSAFVHRLSAVGTGAAHVSGTVTAQAPTVDTATGAHNYAVLRSFAVKGAVVELLDRKASDAVLMQTQTDATGNYVFSGLEAGKTVRVRVKAQLLSTRATGSTTGPQWNIAVRDNTSVGNPKTVYSLDAPDITAVAGANTVNLNAAVGFDSTGKADASGAGRQSAPFSILEVVHTALVKIQETDANLSLPDLNVYWSPANVGASGDKTKGQITTSHYARGGLMPGVFILGKADVDTDEFDQGVIGHEFGHYLQNQLSYSDSPGGAHVHGDFKDASLAYSEGYGTAIGGLLSGSPYYIDSSGPRQGGGGVTDLGKPTPAGKRKGFYSEESVAYVMYQMGVRHGFAPVWRAVSAMRAHHHSATLFAFLNHFVLANPSLPIADVLAAENIRSTHALGQLPAGSSPDPAIDATASKGAGDLEAVYIPVALNPVPAQASAALAGEANAPFCVNRNLKGARNANGLGMHRRFVFTAAFSGSVGVKVLNGAGKSLDLQDHSLNARSELGSDARLKTWAGGLAQFDVVEGRVYTLRFSVDSPNTVFNGNSCGHKLSLWRVAA